MPVKKSVTTWEIVQKVYKERSPGRKLDVKDYEETKVGVASRGGQ